MNASELAQKMLEWETLRVQLDALEDELKEAVLEIGKTQTVGNTRVSYSKGRKSYDYEAGAMDHDDVSDVMIEAYTERRTVVNTDWRGICKRVGMRDIPFIQGEPSATVKLFK